MKSKKKMNMKFLLKSISVSSILIFSSITNTFAGHKNYHLKTTVDYGGFGLLYEIVNDDGNGNGGTKSEYSEESAGYNFEKVKHYGNISNSGYDNNGTGHLTINFNGDRTSPEKRVENYKELLGAGSDTLVFSFPGLKTSHGYKATSNDYTRATQVGDTLVTGLNQALLFIRNNSGGNLSSRTALHLTLGRLSYTSEVSKFTLTVRGTDFQVSPASSSDSDNLIPIPGLDYKDYVKITVLNGDFKGNYSYFPWRMEKGYYPGDALADLVGGTYSTKAKGVENEYLTWGQLILQAMLLADVQGSTEQDFASDVQTIIGQGLGSDLTGTISSVRSLLGLSTMSELVLNMGSRPANYHLGVMSHDMHNIALTVYTLTLMISLTFVGFMIVKMLHQKMLATTNVVAKTTLMEGIKDLAFVAIMLGFFAPLFEMLLELNYLIVRTFSYSSDYMHTFTALGNKALSMESMAGFMVSSMFLSIDMYINFVYLVRAITVSFLFAISPVIIVSYLWSPAQKNLVFGFFRELVGNIFMQSFHAITMTFFSAYNMTNMSSIEALASAYCFVPITQLFRQLVLGNSGGFSEKIGGKLAGQVSSTVTGMQKSAMTAKHSKEMFTAQAKAQADIAQAEKNSGFWSGLGNAITAVGTGIVAGAVTGTVGGPYGTIGGAVVGGVTAIGGLAINGLSANNVADATKTAMGELGSVQGAHADQTLGMGLAELGIGMGVSSFDGAGDRMVMSGLSTMQSGAMMKGQSESRMGQGGEYMGEASADMKMAGAYQNLGYAIGNSLGSIYNDKYGDANKKDKMLKEKELRRQVDNEFNEKYADELEQEQYNKLVQQKQQQRKYNQEFKNEIEQDMYDQKVINHKATTRFESDYEIELNERAIEKIGQQTHNKLVANDRYRDDLTQLGVSDKYISSKVNNDYHNRHEDLEIRDQVNTMSVKDKATQAYYSNNSNAELAMRNQVDNVARSKEANRVYESQNASTVRADNLKRYSDSQQAQSDYETRNPHLVEKQGYDKYVKQQGYKTRYQEETRIDESKDDGNNS